MQSEMNEIPEPEEKSERTLERIAFVAELVWEVLPPTVDRAKKKAIIAEMAESFYVQNKEQFDDAVLVETAKGDFWVRASYIKTYWADIRDYLAHDGRYIAWVTRKGIFKTENAKTIEKFHTIGLKQVKRISERLTLRALLLNKAKPSSLHLPGMVTQTQTLELGAGDGELVS